MSPNTPETHNTSDDLKSSLAKDPGAVLEMLADQHGVSLREVIASLPPTYRALTSGTHAEAIMADVAEWGPITLLVHTPDIILECKGSLPKGKVARGYFNLLGGDAIGGHIRLDRCRDIAFVRRPFMGSSDSCAILFLNQAGDAMFKLFVGRDDNRTLLPDQVNRFCSLRDTLCETSLA